MMTNLLHGAHVVNKLFSTIARLRLLLVMFLTLTVSAEVWGADVTFDATKDKGSTSTGTVSFEKDGITLSVENGALGNGTDYRIYKNTKLTISSSVGTITNIALTYKSASYDGGGWSASYNPNAETWTSPAASGEQARITKIVVTYTSSGGGGSTPTQLAAPTGLTANNITSSGATLSWNTVANASSYTLLVYGENDDDVTEYTGLTQTTKEVSGLEPKTYYLWGVTAIGNGTTYRDSNEGTAEFTTSASAGGDDGDGECTWQLVTDASTLKVDDQIVIAAKEYDYALGTTQRNANRLAVKITKVGNTIAINENVQVITLATASATQTNTFAFYVGTGFLYASSSSSNELKTAANPGENGDWYLEIKNGVASITAQGTNTRDVMQFNLNNNDPAIFACYASASQTSLAIYKKVCTTETTVFVIPKCGGDGGGTWLVVIEWFATF